VIKVAIPAIISTVEREAILGGSGERASVQVIAATVRAGIKPVSKKVATV
jgi:hypothetical protein